MAERSDQRSRHDSEQLAELLDTGTAVENPGTASNDDSVSADPDTAVASRLRGRLGSAVTAPISRPLSAIRGRIDRLFSVRSFGTALLASIAAAIGVGFAIPFIGALGALAGIFAVGVGFGLVSERRQYLEVGLAGAATAALGAMTEFLVVALAGREDLVVLFGVGSGLLAALLGHYVGRDLRSGLTRDI